MVESAEEAFRRIFVEKRVLEAKFQSLVNDEPAVFCMYTHPRSACGHAHGSARILAREGEREGASEREGETEGEREGGREREGEREREREREGET